LEQFYRQISLLKKMFKKITVICTVARALTQHMDCISMLMYLRQILKLASKIFEDMKNKFSKCLEIRQVFNLVPEGLALVP